MIIMIIIVTIMVTITIIAKVEHSLAACNTLVVSQVSNDDDDNNNNINDNNNKNSSIPDVEPSKGVCVVCVECVVSKNNH
jgi:hypothetical protein